MLNEQEAHRQHVLTMIESAQQAGRSEREIVAIVEQYCNTDEPKEEASGRNHLFTRLFALIAA